MQMIQTHMQQSGFLLPQL
uniref:Uncharacterized protein n=1 Tax=Arundo donax TaxID=35708 RepID=A0A0A9B1S5_ARUDO